MNKLNKQVKVAKIKERFKLRQVSGDEESLSRWTVAPDINRPGLELSGYRGEAELKRVVVIGKKEYTYINTLDYETQLDRFGFLTDSYTPCIIVTGGNKAHQALIDVASSKNFPVFEFDGETYQLSSDLVAYLSEKLAESDTLHAGMMNIYGTGVMIMGDSGIGKSELELDLIKRGHIFVADDLVEVTRLHNGILCQAPDNLSRMLEIRGLGVVDVNLIFGGHCFLKRCQLDFVIKLVSLKDYLESNPNRLDPSDNKIDILGIKKNYLEIPITEGKSMSAIVETAVTNYILKKQGFDSNALFKERIINEIKAKKE